MAPASPSALLTVSDRPVVEWLEAKGPEASAGEFAGLMGQLVAPTAPVKPAEAPPSAKHLRSRGPKASVQEPQAEARTTAQTLPEGSPPPAPAPGIAASGPAACAAPAALTQAAAPTVPEEPAQGPEAPPIPLATPSAAPSAAMVQPPAAEAPAPVPSAPLPPAPVALLPLDFSAVLVPVPAPIGLQPAGTASTAAPTPSASLAPLAAPALPVLQPQATAPSVPQEPQVERLSAAPKEPAGPEAPFSAGPSHAPAAPSPAPASLKQAASAPFGSQPNVPGPVAGPTLLTQPLGPSADGPVLASLRPSILPSAPEPQAPAAAGTLNAPTLTALSAEAALPHPLLQLPATLIVASAAPLTTSISAGPQAWSEPSAGSPVALRTGSQALLQAQAAPAPALPIPSLLPTAVPAPAAAEGITAPAAALPSVPTAVTLPQDLKPAPALTTPQADLAEPLARLKATLAVEPALRAADAAASEEPLPDLKPTGGTSLHGARQEPLPSPGSTPVPTPQAALESALSTQAGSPTQGAPALAERPEQKSAKVGPSAPAHPQDGSPLAALSARPPVAEAQAPVSQVATAPAAPPSAPALQLEGGLKWMLKGGAQEAQLQLHPESLGQVTIHLKVEGGEVHVRLWVTDPTSMQAVRDGREHLGVSLKEQGLQLGSFDLQQGHRPFQEAPVTPVVREHVLPERMSTRQEAPVIARPAILNPHHVELYA